MKIRKCEGATPLVQGAVAADDGTFRYLTLDPAALPAILRPATQG